jgi:hypothetical protein
MTATNLVTTKGTAEHELFLNNPASVAAFFEHPTLT